MILWSLITRLGEAQILLPAALLAIAVLGRQADCRAASARWLIALLLGTLITTLSKVAFLGWGLGIAALDFTGFSGHSMYAATVDIPLLACCALALAGRGRVVGALLGLVLALTVGVSRVEVGAHSVSEAVAGLLLGGGLGAWVVTALPGTLPTRATMRPILGLMPAMLALWLSLGVAWAPPPVTHTLVTRLSLALSGREHPYTRAHLHAAPRAMHPGSEARPLLA